MKKIFMFIKYITWTFPFLFFWAGYHSVSQLLPQKTIPVPSLINLPLRQAMLKASQVGLSLTVIEQKEDDMQDEGTILTQTPIAGKKIKLQQTVSVIISCHTNKAKMPDLRGQIIEKEACIETLPFQSVCVPSHYPKNTCIAQIPSVETDLNEQKPITLYLAAQAESLVLMPTLVNRAVPEVQAFMKIYAIDLRVIHHEKHYKNHSCSSVCTIKAQHPVAGTFVDLQTLKTIFIYV